jgi:proteasome lid subunit RPN8/RPN11
VLAISQNDWDEIRRHSEETYPHECCGALIGEMEDGRNLVKATIRCGNTRDDSPHNRYHIDPRELVKIQREGRERGYDIVGFYHSHPDHSAQWSQTDLVEAHWIGCSYVITSVEKGRAVLTTSFVLAGTLEEDKRFEDEEVQVVDGCHHCLIGF